MIENIRIENFKSIEDLPIQLGRLNIFIGENGAGKSNILEAIALAAAAEADKLDNEFLASRGVRVTSAKLMRSAFRAERSREPIAITVRQQGGSDCRYELRNDNKPYSAWEQSVSVEGPNATVDQFAPLLRSMMARISDEEERKNVINDIARQFQSQLEAALDASSSEHDGEQSAVRIELKFRSKHKLYGSEGMNGCDDFLIYSPENSALRTFEREGQIQPLGISGEGLLRFLEVLSSEKNKAPINTIKDALRLFGWFEDFEIRKRRTGSRMKIVDHFLDQRSSGFDQRSANEGFLFLAFYFSALSSRLTPSFFAIDNVDTALNPKLCQRVVKEIFQLAKANEKQIILTAHNPAVLDGLNINDDEQRLFIISRGQDGQTRARRYERKQSNGEPTRLSELFIRGALGGLPKGF